MRPKTKKIKKIKNTKKKKGSSKEANANTQHKMVGLRKEKHVCQYKIVYFLEQG